MSTLWNVVVPVVANVQADTGEQAQQILLDSLQDAGFPAYNPADFGSEVSLHPFESKDDVDPDILPDVRAQP